MSLTRLLSPAESCPVYRHALAYLMVAALLPTLTASVFDGVVSRLVNESESPLENGEETEETADERRSNVQRRIRVAAEHGHLRTARQRLLRSRHSPPCVTRCVDGHRLSNGLLAPLTC
ncbi:MAG: hypothetical protein VX346_01100 [Planctomycetota bacterium]|nr:hypothetical protein [Planctomycetota bacterium]